MLSAGCIQHVDYLITKTARGCFDVCQSAAVPEPIMNGSSALCQSMSPHGCLSSVREYVCCFTQTSCSIFIRLKMNTDNRSYLTTIAISFAVTISCVAIFLRLLARKVQRLPILADDYTIIAGAVS